MTLPDLTEGNSIVSNQKLNSALSIVLLYCSGATIRFSHFPATMLVRSYFLPLIFP